MSNQPIRLTRRGELVFGALGALLALVVMPACWTLAVALLTVAP